MLFRSSTGLPTHTSQGDLTFTYFISHGDKDMIILLPGDVEECFEFGWKALDIAEQLQTPVIVLSDLELGMNIWEANPFAYPEQKMERGKVLWEKDLETLIKKSGQWGRYQDIDGDGIPYRTIPGNLHEKAAYFTRGTGHDDFAHYSEENRDWENNLLRLKKKIESAKNLIPPAELVVETDSRIGLIAYGSTKMSAREAVDMLNHNGRQVDFLRIKALPFTDEVEKFLESHDRIYIAEANRDGQMKQIMSVNFPEHAAAFRSIARCDGLSLSAEWIVNQIEKMEG